MKIKSAKENGCFVNERRLPVPDIFAITGTRISDSQPGGATGQEEDIKTAANDDKETSPLERGNVTVTNHNCRAEISDNGGTDHNINLSGHSRNDNDKTNVDGKHNRSANHIDVDGNHNKGDKNIDVDDNRGAGTHNTGPDSSDIDGGNISVIIEINHSGINRTSIDDDNIEEAMTQEEEDKTLNRKQHDDELIDKLNTLHTNNTMKEDDIVIFDNPSASNYAAKKTDVNEKIVQKHVNMADIMITDKSNDTDNEDDDEGNVNVDERNNFNAELEDEDVDANDDDVNMDHGNDVDENEVRN